MCFTLNTLLYGTQESTPSLMIGKGKQLLTRAQRSGFLMKDREHLCGSWKRHLEPHHRSMAHKPRDAGTPLLLTWKGGKVVGEGRIWKWSRRRSLPTPWEPLSPPTEQQCGHAWRAWWEVPRKGCGHTWKTMGQKERMGSKGPVFYVSSRLEPSLGRAVCLPAVCAWGSGLNYDVTETAMKIINLEVGEMIK